jgi:hypothetical protein
MEECCPQARTKLCFPKNSEARDGLEREVAPAMVDTPAPSPRLGMATSAPAHEIFTEISSENVAWGEEVMANHDTDNCLHLSISDEGKLDSKKAEQIMEFDDVGSIIWDKDVPHILDMHINALEQFTSVKQAVLMAPIMPNGDVEGLLSEVSSQVVSMTSFYSEDATYSAFDGVPLLDVTWDAMSADADEGFKVVWDTEAPCGENAKLTEAGVELQLSPSSLEAIRKLEVGMCVAEHVYAPSFVECIQVDQRLKEKMPAWRCNSVDPVAAKIRC